MDPVTIQSFISEPFPPRSTCFFFPWPVAIHVRPNTLHLRLWSIWLPAKFLDNVLVGWCFREIQGELLADLESFLDSFCFCLMQRKLRGLGVGVFFVYFGGSTYKSCDLSALDTLTKNVCWCLSQPLTNPSKNSIACWVQRLLYSQVTRP